MKTWFLLHPDTLERIAKSLNEHGAQNKPTPDFLPEVGELCCGLYSGWCLAEVKEGAAHLSGTGTSVLYSASLCRLSEHVVG